ncbi:sodium/glutamate symporter [[Clostridium] sordellii]|uniref:Sodium/glutamate symporter n=1 Tax=Paraclostridium sordellii TaxID=1505 RepID=A0ABM9RQA7_PARSO|nr:sodium/glutamate symporter [Paeniclostridium sordellii]CEJ73986.1 sodium/glutamate symport carrier protein [[Clostridium] sordellii] [Paeniclostridium sordellii]CEN69531.1 sodium/glutamate symporter [[Clostridium] sordellii] [Paeniclostridium sordellii]CEN72799.1 sodium/glutamate symporter [[Clostridium] sordellii] [Paeniclostridium sordellii]CEP75608.1 sodium/glutamate symporter [[Clostridium] sordellii] [Paeniclostridium sordellii]
MFEVNLSMIQSIAFTTIVLIIGSFIKERVNIFKKYCIPAPVVGGFSFAIISFLLRKSNLLYINFDTTLQNILMTAFFTTVGFTASISILKKGGSKVLKFLVVAVLLVLTQNIVGVLSAKAIGVNPLLGLIAGSVSMTGGHGASGAFGPVIESSGLNGALSISMACATFGLVSGSIIGGPLGKRLIEKYNLSSDECESDRNNNILELSLEGDGTCLGITKGELSEIKLTNSVIQIVVAMGLGTIISSIFSLLKITIPEYIGAMIIAAIMRNFSDIKGIWETSEKELSTIGSICLSLFLSMAMCSLKLWELIDLAIPIIIVLGVQTIIMILFAYFITFKVMGKDYTAAILAAGHCGFGMGATPNGIANMESITSKYGPSTNAFFILPLVGALFIEFFNSATITTFINLLG